MKTKKMRITISALAALMLLIGYSTIGYAQPNFLAKNIVIVHGAFADASGWEAVYKILKKDHYQVTLVQNPLTSLEDDVAATSRALDKQDGPVVLVGHSWGGTVITQAGASPKVVSLVYVAAFVPDVNESTLSLIESAPALPVNGVLPPDANGWVYFDRAKFRECFAAEQTEEKAAFMFDAQQPISGKTFAGIITEAAWKTRAVYAIVAMEDKSINPDLERLMYKRANAHVTEIKGYHTLFMSHAMAVAKVIEAASAGHSVQNR